MKSKALYLGIALFQILAGLLGLGVAGLGMASQAFGGEPGLHVDLGARSAVWDRSHRFGLGGGAGLAMAAGRNAEIEVRGNYAFIPARVEAESLGAVEMGLGEVAAYFAPYRGMFRPMIGGHAGLVRMDGEMHWNVGMDAMAIFCVSDRLQLYGNAVPSLLFTEGQGDVWLRIGAGMRIGLGR